MDNTLVTTAEASKLLCISPKTLEAMRVRGDGPIFTRVSRKRIAYRLIDLNSYIESRLHQSTSEYQAHNRRLCDAIDAY